MRRDLLEPLIETVSKKIWRLSELGGPYGYWPRFPGDVGGAGGTRYPAYPDEQEEIRAVALAIIDEVLAAAEDGAVPPGRVA